MPTSASPPVSYKPVRLGVNPRRSHVADPERKRCKTACNVCNTRRIKCSGTQPCSQCTLSQRACEYPVVEKKIQIAESAYKDLCARVEALEVCLSGYVTDPVERQSLVDRVRQSLAAREAPRASPSQDEASQGRHSPAASSSTIASSTVAMSPEQHQQHYAQYSQQQGILFGTPATEGKLLEDNDGAKRWLGGTSGATFLDHLKKFMQTLKSSLGYNTMTGSQFMNSRGLYQTSDSRHLFATITAASAPTTYSNNWALADSHLAKVSAFLQGPTLPIQDKTKALECGGIHYFGEFSFHEWAAVLQDEKRSSELAFYEAAFALGTIYSLTVTNSRRDGQLGERYFANARRILGEPMDVSRYSMRDVATLGMLGLYFSEMNRRDNAWMYLSHAMTLCCMFGGLKGPSTEGDKRVIWTLFCLTRDLGCLMGRPPLFPLEAFQLPYPEAVLGLPRPDGLIAHVELSKIADYIVSNSYAIAPRESQDEMQAPDQVDKPMRMLKEWTANLPEHLRIHIMTPANDSYESRGVPPDRSLLMLHMKWNQLVILALRPMFFTAVKSAVGADFVSNTWRDVFGDQDEKRVEYILECRAAARRNLWLGRYINEMFNAKGREGRPAPGASGDGKLVMLDLHHIFNAAVILLLYQMVSSNVVNTDTYGITQARRVFEIEAHAEGVGSAVGTAGYASDCVGVLGDLAALVAHIRPLRFKDSEYVHTGIDVMDWGGIVPRQTTPGAVLGGVDMAGGGTGSSNRDGGCCPTGTIGSAMVAIPSQAQLAENLNLTSPYGPDGAVYSQLFGAENQQQQMEMSIQPLTIRDEMKNWLKEDDGTLYCNGVPLGGFTGL